MNKCVRNVVNLARVECGEKTECAERIDSVDSTADSTESAFHHIPPNTRAKFLFGLALGCSGPPSDRVVFLGEGSDPP